MKRIILTLIVILTVSVTFGQNKWHEKQNDYFADAAAKEYSLTDEQKEELKVNRMEMVTAFITSNKEFKADKISKEEKQETTKEASKKFNGYFSQLVGKSYKEVAPFLDKMREEIKNIK